MKQVKRMVGFILLVAMIGGFFVPQVSVDAASNVKIIYNGKTKAYSKKKTAIYVNGKKISLSQVPIFLKSGSYMGPANQIFKSSQFKVAFKESKNHKVLIMTYMNHVLRMTSGSKVVTIDGERDEFGTAPLYATYKSSGITGWIVPIKSICNRLGMTYKNSSSGKLMLSGEKNGVVNPSTQESTNAAAASSNKKFVVVLDAGHGGSDSGTRENGLAEKNLTLSIILAAKKEFDKDSRFAVYYTRTKDTYPTLPNRCKYANNLKADVFISVHINSGNPKSKTATGTETWYRANRSSSTANGNINSKDLALNMQKAMLSATGFPNRGIVNDYRNLCVLRETKMPACLIEVGFLSKKAEATKMKLNTSRYGKALYSGLVTYLKAKGRIR